MIPARELRIGNWIDTPNGIKEVTGIISGSHVSVVHFDKMDHGAHCLTNLCNPIPLNPKILEKCAFYELQRSTCFWNEYFDIGVSIENGNFSLYDNIDLSTPTLLLKYLHQFQNIIFDLTGEELKISFYE